MLYLSSKYRLRRPWVTYALIAANLLCFILMLPLGSQAPDVTDPALRSYLELGASDARLIWFQLLQGVSAQDLFLYNHGFKPVSPSFGTLMSSLFLHTGWIHLLGNVLFLWAFGMRVERRLGHKRYLLVYLALGVLAAWGFLMAHPLMQRPLVGASGAISGLMGCYLVWFPAAHTRFRLLGRAVRIRHRWVIAFYFLATVALMVATGDVNSVAHDVHIVGFLAGSFIAAFHMRSRRGGLRHLTPVTVHGR